MGLFDGESTRPNTAAASELERVTRQRFNDMRSMYKPIESGVIPTVGNQNYIDLQSKIAGRAAGESQDLMNRAEDNNRARRGLKLSDSAQKAVDRRRLFEEKTGVRRAQTLGELTAIDNDRTTTAGVVDAGNAVYGAGVNSLANAAQLQAQANAAGVATGASRSEKIAGILTGAVNGAMTGGPAGAIVGGGLAASAYA